MRKLGLAVVVGLMTTPLLAASAWAAPACISGGSVASYEALGAGGCSVGGVTFFDILVTPTVSGSGTVSLTSFNTVMSGGEFGLQLIYSANTGTTPGSSADVAWTYQVSGNLLSDAVMSFAGNTNGPGATATSSEILSNGTTLSLSGPGSTSATFTPIAQLGAIKDQNDYSGNCPSEIQCSASSSILENDFSLSATPIPGALPLFATGLVGFWGLRKRRNKQVASLAA